jgi:hypothetical protein
MKAGKLSYTKEVKEAKEAKEATKYGEPFLSTTASESDGDNEEVEVEALTTKEQRLEAFFVEKECEDKKKPIINSMAKRLAVAYLFINVHGALEDENDWKGQDSVGPKINKALGLSIGTCIYPIFRNVLACKKERVSYTGARSMESLLGRSCTISLDSVEAQIIVDSSEDGFGREHTKLQVNKHRKEQNLPSYTTGALAMCIRNLKPKVE